VVVDGEHCGIDVRASSTGSLLGVERRTERRQQSRGLTLCASFVELRLALLDALLRFVERLLSNLLRLVQESSHEVRLAVPTPAARVS
jgi:hypothetical protein